MTSLTKRSMNKNRRVNVKMKVRVKSFQNFVLMLIALVFAAVSFNIFQFHANGSGSGSTEHSDHSVTSMDFGEEGGKSASNTATDTDTDTDTTISKIADEDRNGRILPEQYRHETNIFRRVMERAASVARQCKDLPEHHKGEPPKKTFDTGVPPLPERGVYNALKEWLEKEENGTNSNSNRNDYPMCYLPPSKSCHVTKFSVILMSHTVDDARRLEKLKKGIQSIAGYKGTSEIILVWNAPRSVLEESNERNAKVLRKWDKDEKFPLRIFYALENGLHNNLLNRYHPKIQPKEEAIVYFDDDGPFFSQDTIQVGFELWRFNSDIQVGAMPRNIRFPSKRMNDLQTDNTALLAELYRKDAWQTHVHPYDSELIQKIQMEKGVTVDVDVDVDHAGYPQFTPLCNEESGDVAEYNYYAFPHYKAHMTLPSNSILHRNYLCFMWHPAFQELRQFILDHPTHPDDMTISTLVTHLSGKSVRTLPRTMVMIPEPKEEETEDDGEEKQERRKLLWQQKDWGDMREEAINSVVRYFGSINPGSVGWCAGTKYELEDSKAKGSFGFNCPNNRKAYIDQIPWMNEGGLGYNECHT